MSFTEYLAKRRATYDTAGDFAAEASRDPRLSAVGSLAELEIYIDTRFGLDGAAAAKKLWRAYGEQVHKMKST